MWAKSFLYAEQPVNVVKIRVDHGNEADIGSGSLIRGDLVLTNNHVVRDYRAGDTIEVEFKTDLVRTGKIIKVDSKWDLAVIQIKPVLYPVVRPAAKAVIKGQTVNICGFPKGKEYGEKRGRVYNFRSPTSKDPSFLFTVNVKSISGMSGGPVFNDGGELVGVLFGSKVYSNCVGLQAIKQFLKGIDLE
jgi:S1-C subfamily serine protease